MTPTTYWPTYEGLRILQDMDCAELILVREELDTCKSPFLLQRRNNLEIRIQTRYAKLDKLARIARDVLTNQSSSLDSGSPDLSEVSGGRS